MDLETRIEARGFELSEAETSRIEHHLEALAQRLADRPRPIAEIVLYRHEAQRLVEVDFRLQLGPLGSHLVSHQAAETADRAVRLAIEDVERELERQLASQRGEPSFGVPSRRLPAQLRPNPPPPRGESAPPEEAEK